MIAENAAENKVFFVASADNKTNTDGTENRSLWYKVKVTRNGEGYRVEYGKVGDTTPKTVEIAKNPIYNFVGLSLESGEKVDAQAEEKMGYYVGLCCCRFTNGFRSCDFFFTGCGYF